MIRMPEKCVYGSSVRSLSFVFSLIFCKDPFPGWRETEVVLLTNYCMKTLLKLEELALFAGAVVLFNQLEYAWWVFLAWLLVPDVSMIGYAAGPRAGAWVYNLFHHRAVAVGTLAAGFYVQNAPLQLAGIILFAHIAMDRMLGYGLKYPDNFKHTHLGKIGP